MTAVLSLSPGEFMVLYAAFGEPECAGLDVDVLQRAAGDSDTAVRAGLDALQRRGLVTRDGATLRVHQPLASIGELLFFPDVAIVRWDETETEQSGFAALHIGGDTLVRWTFSASGWEGALSSDLPEALASLCHPIPSGRPPDVCVKVPTRLFPGFRAIADRDVAGAARRIEQSAVNGAHAAAALAAALAATKRQHVFAVLAFDEGTVVAATNLIAFIADGVAWQLTPDAADASLLECVGIDRVGVAASLARAVATR